MIVHTSDDQCDVGADGTCCGCGAAHLGAPCPRCNGAAYHRPGCDLGDPPEGLAIMFGARTVSIDSTPEHVAAMLGDLGPAVQSEDRIAAEVRARLDAVPAILGLELGAAPVRVLEAEGPAAWPLLDPRRRPSLAAGVRDPIRILQVSPADLEPGRGARLAAAEVIDQVVPRSPAELEVERVDRALADAAELLEVATAHGFGHADVGGRALVQISGPPSAGSRYVDVRVYVGARDQQQPRRTLALLHELAAAVLRATSGDWPVAIVVAGDDRLPSGYVGRLCLELDRYESRGAALEQLRAMPELGSRPW